MRELAWDAYAESVAAEPMIVALAAAAKEAREKAERKIIHIAVVADMDPSTIWRFEHGQWPRNADQIIAAYAAELEIEPFDLWQRALEIWSATEQPTPDRAARGVEVARQATQTTRERSQRAQGATRRKRAAG